MVSNKSTTAVGVATSTLPGGEDHHHLHAHHRSGRPPQAPLPTPQTTQTQTTNAAFATVPAMGFFNPAATIGFPNMFGTTNNSAGGYQPGGIDPATVAAFASGFYAHSAPAGKSTGASGRGFLQATTSTSSGNAQQSQQQQQQQQNQQRNQQNQQKKNLLKGVVFKVTEETISIALFESSSKSSSNQKSSRDSKNANHKNNNPNEADDEEEASSILNSSATFSLVFQSNVEVHRKMRTALDELSHYGLNHPIASAVLHEIFSPSFSSTKKEETTPITPSSPHFNPSQIQAIEYSLSPKQPLSLIHGPPGTGKTTTLVELIHQSLTLFPNKTILVTAPSNIAVDTILQKCSERFNHSKKYKLLRIGHPARISKHTLRHSLEHVIYHSDENQILQSVHDELQGHINAINQHYQSFHNDKQQQKKKHRLTPVQRRHVKQEMKFLRKEIKQRHQKMIHSLVSSAHVVFATNVGCATLSKKLIPPKHVHMNLQPHSAAAPKNYFDICIMDEAAQSLPCAALLPMLLSKKIILAGDDCQLPPTITSQLAQSKQLDETFFDLIQEPKYRKLLNTQYRMNEIISNWASSVMYHNQLLSHDSVKHHTLEDLSHVTTCIPQFTNAVMMLIDTAGCDAWEQVQDTSNGGTGSKYNSKEADIVQQHIHELIQIGMTQEEIAVITPYNAQVELLRNLLLESYPKVEIKSVDGFQGGERDVILLSLVRSNEPSYSQHNKTSEAAGVGFLRDKRRINVAVTRAKRHVSVICDSETVSRDPFLNDLLDWIQEYGEVRSAMEYLEQDNIGAADVSDDFDLEGIVSGHSEISSADLDLVEQMMKEAATISKSNKTPSKSTDQSKSKSNEKKQEMEQQKQTLKTRIGTFVQTGAPGEELKFESSLTKRQRQMVHEIAEELGLDHESEGKHEIDRRIIVTLPKPKETITTNHDEGISKDVVDPSSSSKLEEKERNNDDDSDSSSLCVTESKKSTTTNTTKMAPTPDTQKEEEEESTQDIYATNNDLLKRIAMERLERQKQQNGITEESKAISSQKKKNKKKSKSNSKKTGGNNSNSSTNNSSSTSNNKNKNTKTKEKAGDDLDDMAFLDAQIEKVQTSHGKKVEGSGKTYRTIINGILLEKPKRDEVKKDAKASAALKAKLKKAEDDRKAKTKSKKKK